MSDLLDETILYLGQATRLLPRDQHGRPPSTTTLWRWRTRGIRGIRLETARLGGRVVTSAEAIRRFIRMVSDMTSSQTARESHPLDRTAEQTLASAALDDLWERQ